MSNNALPSFAKIHALGATQAPEIFWADTDCTDAFTVKVTEKLDGSQFVFGKINNVVRARSKNRELNLECPDKLFAVAVERLKEIAPELPNNVVFYCEYLRQPKHNVLKYDTVPKNNLALFATYNHDGDFYETHPDFLLERANGISIDVAQTVGSGQYSEQYIQELIADTPSQLGGKMEGVVIKQDLPWFLPAAQKWFSFRAIKVVSTQFKETMRTQIKKANPKNNYEEFSKSLCTPARWQKAVQHLRENGTLLEDVRDIGPLCKEVQRDVAEECKEEIMQFLWHNFGRDIIKKTSKGLAEWYKEQLAASSEKE